MRIYAREYKWYKDLFFQCHVLFDKSIQNIMFDNRRKALGYFMPGRFFAKYTVIRVNDDGTKERTAIGAFLKDHRKNVCWIAGFVPTEMQNKGLGVYGGIACLNELFKRSPDCTVYSASYSSNTRAVRVTTSIGFRLYVQDEKHFEASLTKEQFDNEFVRQIKRRCNIE